MDMQIVTVLLTCFACINSYPFNEDKVESRICDTEICYETAAYLVRAMDFGVDPCVDFYEFACGGWTQETPIPPFLPAFGTLHQLAVNVANKTRGILENWPLNGTGIKALDLAASIYKKCTEIEFELGPDSSSGLRDLLKDLGGWPIADSTWTEDGYSVTRALAYLTRELGIPLLIGFTIDTDFTNASNHIIQLQTPDQESSLSRHLLLQRALAAQNITTKEDGKEEEEEEEDEATKQYRVFVEGVTCLINPDCTRGDNMRKDVKNMMAIEFTLLLSSLLSATKTTNIGFGHQILNSYLHNNPGPIELPPMEENDIFVKQQILHSASMADIFINPQKYKMKVGEAQRSLGNFSLVEFLNLIFQDSGVTIDEDDYIITVLPALKTIVDIIAGAKHAKRDLANYIGFSMLQKVAPRLSEPYRNLQFRAIKEDYGLEIKTPTWMTCVEAVNEVLPFAAGRLFVDHSLTDIDRTEARRMVQTLKASFHEMLFENTWMDKQTRDSAVLKLENMEELIGYPDWIKDNKELNKFYHIKDLNESDYFGTLRQIMNKSFSWKLKQLKSPVVRGAEWVSGSPAEVNAFYYVNDNSIIFPSGVLNWPVFAQGRPSSINYGSLGYVIGHEITHGFDDTGKRFDGFGNIKNWWTNHTATKFEQLSQCISQQYSQVVDIESNKTLNGNLTLGEDIADNGGLREAFKAYKMNRGDVEERLPGLEYMSEDQLFFLSSANTWCTKTRKEVLQKSQSKDPHSPARYRVLFPFRNSRDFAEAFHCPPGSPMNPTEKCVLW